MFENIKFSENDYVLIDGAYFGDGEPKKAKIERINGNWYSGGLFINTIIEMLITSQMILRKLTSKEIEEFELEYNTSKYNL